MLIELHPQNPNPRELSKVLDVLRKGGIIIYPTDTVYGLGCDITHAKAVERICKLKNINVEKANLSFICYDLSHISDFTKPISNSVFRVMKKALPGPFTFLLEANNKLPSIFKHRKSVGIRVPDNNIIRNLVKELGNPILTTSVHNDDEILEYITDPSLIHEKYKDIVDLVIDGGIGGLNASTVVDCTDGNLEIIRQGLGDLSEFLG